MAARISDDWQQMYGQVIKPARNELIRQAAQGMVFHNDDTSMRALMLKRDPSDERTGVFTSGIVSVDQGWKIALYFTGGRYAGENLAEVLKQRSAELPNPIQMCDALTRNVPKLSAGVEILVATCLAQRSAPATINDDHESVSVELDLRAAKAGVYFLATTHEQDQASYCYPLQIK
jgi:hypothetical protein